MKPTPLSAMLADDLLLDRVGARLEADDELGSLLLAVAHRADTPIPRATLTRRVRPHRGLTVLAALGVAVSGATVAAAVELGPMAPDQGPATPHARAYLPPSLQALVLPFLSGSPFQGRLVLPFGGLTGVQLVGGPTAGERPATAFPSTDTLVEPLPGTATDETQSEQQDSQRQKLQAKGTPATGQGQTTPSGDDVDSQGSTPVEAAPEPKPKPEPKPAQPTSTPTSGGAANGATNAASGQANGATNGQANGAANGHGNAYGRSGSGTPAGDPTGGTGTTTGGDPSGATSTNTSPDTSADTSAETEDDPASRAPAKGKGKTKAVTGVPVAAATGPVPASTITSSVPTGDSTGP